MDFDRLLSEILLTVVQRLPFKERIRIACVNRRFKDVAEMAISQTKALCLTAPIFRNANTELMSKLIQLCAPKLKELICEFPHPTQDQYRSTILKRLQNIMKFPPPRLEVLKLDTKFFNCAEALQQLLSRLPNLHAIEWANPPSEFPKTVCENLECARLCWSSIDFVGSVADYWPNVKHVILEGFPYDDQNFRCGCYFTDQVMGKISSGFRQLESLEIKYQDKSLHVTNQWMAALKNLKQLRIFKLNWLTNPNSVHIYDGLDQSLEELVNCESLQVVELDGWHVSSFLLVAFAHRWSKLRRLQVQNITWAYSRRKVKSFVKSLDGFVQEDLTIHLTRADPEVWQCAKVQSAIARIQSPNHQLSFTVGRDDHSQNDNETSRINEWDKDPDCHREKTEKPVAVKPVKPMKSFGQRFIDAIWNLPSKLFKIFK